METLKRNFINAEKCEFLPTVLINGKAFDFTNYAYIDTNESYDCYYILINKKGNKYACVCTHVESDCDGISYNFYLYEEKSEYFDIDYIDFDNLTFKELYIIDDYSEVLQFIAMDKN